ncbi:MAG: radical SAM protein, partial [Promethearchaeota archaeon]
MVRIIHERFKSILNKLKRPDSWFWCRYTLNPFNGCEHGCIYCDARSKRYYLHEGFDNVIIVKDNAAVMLDKILSRPRAIKTDVICFGGVCDAYQPIEETTKVSRNLLKVLEKHGFPVFLSTKSSLITRDIDLLSKIGKKSWCTVNFTITTLDEETWNFLEPRASPPKDRLKAMKMIKNRGINIRVGTNFMPIIPFLEDSEDNIEAVIKQTKRAGGEHVLFSPGLTLRDVQGEFFLKKVKKKYPELERKIRVFYHGQRKKREAWNDRLNKFLYETCMKHDLKVRIKRYYPKDFRGVNYKVAEILLNKAYIDKVKGKKWKSFFNAGMIIQDLNESIRIINERNKWNNIPGIDATIIRVIRRILSSMKARKNRDLI